MPSVRHEKSAHLWEMMNEEIAPKNPIKTIVSFAFYFQTMLFIITLRLWYAMNFCFTLISNGKHAMVSGIPMQNIEYQRLATKNAKTYTKTYINAPNNRQFRWENATNKTKYEWYETRVFSLLLLAFTEIIHRIGDSAKQIYSIFRLKAKQYNNFLATLHVIKP